MRQALCTLAVAVAGLAGTTAAPPPTCKAAGPHSVPFSTTEVSFERPATDTAAAFKLAGSLSVPRSTEDSQERFPAVVFFSGTSLQDRNGTQGNIDIGTHELLDVLASSGNVVLRWDDRGAGQSEVPVDTPWEEVGFHDFVGDGRAALDYLRSREEVDPKRIFLIGHSEGGITAALLANESSTEVGGIVLMAASGRNFFDLTLEQTKRQVAGRSEESVEAHMALQREIQTAVKEKREPDWGVVGEDWEELVHLVWETKVLPIKKWWYEHFHLDVDGLYASLKAPILIVNGKGDFQTDWYKDGRKIAAAVVNSGLSHDITVRDFDDLDHLFKPCGGRKCTREMYTQDRRVDPPFISAVTEWISTRAENKDSIVRSVGKGEEGDVGVGTAEELDQAGVSVSGEASQAEAKGLRGT
uniref:Serine aminopeptidase S33 domain-containing protein n=1 Tax=Chromera velia CCMP2878 TaxID=1169474 RepID=A0A0G4G4N9_9ALVE|eukprot:Cvel_20229.t1-p1 / transcript=Cvel_20229.t1 / gene=Cvel_20229 / organism=Chromera_velia_CCMP2878 / gene_product=hypothetical protein / transcript_product=hypothetical protein / location=Cvel_scaffold1802:10073-11308(+) / protein_length=412 / sequence_SO=supercontig / SO=protein_coding / is_pseudo=false